MRLGFIHWFKIKFRDYTAMKILTKILIPIYLLLEVIQGQCIGDINTDYRVDQNDLSIFSDYLLSANDTIINFADIDYNNSVDIFVMRNGT